MVEDNFPHAFIETLPFVAEEIETVDNALKEIAETEITLLGNLKLEDKILLGIVAIFLVHILVFVRFVHKVENAFKEHKTIFEKSEKESNFKKHSEEFQREFEARRNRHKNF